MNIYANIINRFFDYKGQTYQVTSDLFQSRSFADDFHSWRECKNIKTGKVVKFFYQEFWNVTPRGYTHNGIIEGA